jgi:hypothetical protein
MSDGFDGSVFDGEIIDPVEIGDNCVPDILPEQLYFARNLARFGDILVNGVNITPCDTDLSLAGLSLFHRFSITWNGHECQPIHSACGLEDVSLENLSVIAGGVKPITGSGTRLATEWWEKKNGTDIITLHLGDTILAMFYDKRWKLTTSNQFLYEGAELVDNVIYLREEVGECFCIEALYRCKHVVLDKHNFDHHIPEDIEGIVTMIDHKMYRLKYENTLDLVCRGGYAYTQDGTKKFECDYRLQGIHEFTTEGRYVKQRTDKKYPDTDTKVTTILQLPTLYDLKEKLKIVDSSGHDFDIHDQWIGYEALKEEDEPISFSRNVLWQILSPDQLSNVKNDKKEILSIAQFISRDRHFFEYRRYVNKLKRTGISFVTRDLRKHLIDNGILPWYGHWKVTPKSTSHQYIPQERCRVPTTHVKMKINVDQGWHGGSEREFSPGYYPSKDKELEVSKGRYQVSEKLRKNHLSYYKAHISTFAKMNWTPNNSEGVMLSQMIMDILIKEEKDYVRIYRGIIDTFHYVVDEDVLKQVLSSLILHKALRFHDGKYSIVIGHGNDAVLKLGQSYLVSLDEGPRMVVGYVQGAPAFKYVVNWKKYWDTPIGQTDNYDGVVPLVYERKMISAASQYVSLGDIKWRYNGVED